MVATGFVDLHTHLLPGVDDGVRDLPEALEQLREARRQGIAALVCTPHTHRGYGSDLTSLARERRRVFERLVAAAAAERESGGEQGELPQVGLGAELLILGGRVSLEPPDVRINGTAYALLEVPFDTWEFRALGGLFRDLLDRGYRPILAHAERYPHLAEHPDLFAAWREDGLLTQANATSFVGRHGEAIRRRAFELLDAGEIDLVASDVHGPHMRLNHMAEAHTLVLERAGAEVARRLFSNNPRAIYLGRDVPGEGSPE
jgi:protein-tyrosine phosphatase